MINKEFGQLDNVIVRRSGSVQSSPSAASGYIASGETEAIEVHGTLNTLKTLYQQISEDATDTTKIVSLSYQEAVGKKETPEKTETEILGQWPNDNWTSNITPSYTAWNGLAWEIWATPAFRSGGYDILRLVYIPAIIPSAPTYASLFNYSSQTDKYKYLNSKAIQYIGRAGEHGQLQIPVMMRAAQTWPREDRFVIVFSSSAPDWQAGKLVDFADIQGLSNTQIQVQNWDYDPSGVDRESGFSAFNGSSSTLGSISPLGVAMQIQNASNNEAAVWSNCRAMPCYVKGIKITSAIAPENRPIGDNDKYYINILHTIGDIDGYLAVYSPISGEGENVTLEFQGIMDVASSDWVPIKVSEPYGDSYTVYLYFLQNGNVNPPKLVRGNDVMDKSIFLVQSMGGIYLTNQPAPTSSPTEMSQSVLCGYSTFASDETLITKDSFGQTISYPTIWYPSDALIHAFTIEHRVEIVTPAKSEAYYDGTITTTYYIPDPSEEGGGGGDPDPSDDPDYESSVVISTTIVQQNVDTMPSGAVDTGDVEQATAQNEACYNALRAGLKYYAWNGKNVIVTEAGCGPLLDRNKRQKALGNYSVSVPQTQATLTWGDKAGRPTLPAPPFANMVWSKMAESTTRKGNKTQHVENWSASPIGGWAMRQSST